MTPDEEPEAAHPARLRVGLIGAGRAGTVLAAALRRAGHEVVAVAAVSETSKARAGRLLPGVPVRPADQVVTEASLALLTVPDDALGPLVSGLVTAGVPVEGRLLAHASGRHGLAVLDPATRRGALPLALHPVMTFTGRADDLDKLAGISFGVTAPEPLRAAAEVLVMEMGGEPVLIAEEDRDLYHAALASGANHLVTLVAQSRDLLARAGVANPGRMLSPLLFAALDNALRLGDGAPDRAGGQGRRQYRGRAPGRAAAGRAGDRGRLPGAGPAHRGPGAGGRLAGPGRRAAAARRARRGAAVTPIVARTRTGLAAARAGLPGPVVLVPTMGALHDGHRALLRCAREAAGPDGSVLVSIFVNPLQFGPAEDFGRYPRPLADDLAVCAEEGAALVFTPDPAQMYPEPQQITVDPGPAGQRLEGASRPGFFTGVLTVVLKLLQLTRPDAAVFGEKDAQQLALVRRMVTDLCLPAADRGGAHRQGPGRAGRLQPERLPVRARAGHRAGPARRAARGPGAGQGRPGGGAGGRTGGARRGSRGPAAAGHRLPGAGRPGAVRAGERGSRRRRAAAGRGESGRDPADRQRAGADRPGLSGPGRKSRIPKTGDQQCC